MSTAPEPPAPQESRATRQQQESMAAPPKLRRRPMLIAVSVILTAVGALLTAWLLQVLAGTESVVAVRDDIQRGEIIQEEDLTQANISMDSAVHPVKWEQRHLLVDQYAYSDMPAGSLVVDKSYGPSVIPGKGQALVGLYIEPGKMPATELQSGDQVRVVYPASDEDPTKTEVTVGDIAQVTASPDRRGTIVDVVVDSGKAPALAAAGSLKTVSIVLNSRDAADRDATASNAAEGVTEATPTGSATSAP